MFIRLGLTGNHHSHTQKWYYELLILNSYFHNAPTTTIFLPNWSKLCSTFTFTMYGILNKRPYRNGFVRNSLSKGDFNCGASSKTAIILNYFLSYVPSNFFAFPKFSSNFLSSSQFPPSLVCFSCFSLPWQYVLPMVQKLPVSAKICTYAQEKRSWL